MQKKNRLGKSLCWKKTLYSWEFSVQCVRLEMTGEYDLRVTGTSLLLMVLDLWTYVLHPRPPSCILDTHAGSWIPILQLWTITLSL